MLAKFKWLIVLICFYVQYTLLPLFTGVEIYPDLMLACICALGLIYGALCGLFYGILVGVAASVLFTLSLTRTVAVYTLCGLICGLLSVKARGSRILLPVFSVAGLALLRNIVDIITLVIARAPLNMGTVVSRTFTAVALTVLCALLLYNMFYQSKYRYRVVGKRVGR